jgi:hypothetical protein
VLTTGELLQLALHVLKGVGDVSAGEWGELGDVAYHLRRRLSAFEAKRIGPVIDCRRTDEGLRRLELARRWLRDPAIAAYAVREVGGTL